LKSSNFKKWLKRAVKIAQPFLLKERVAFGHNKDHYHSVAEMVAYVIRTTNATLRNEQLLITWKRLHQIMKPNSEFSNFTYWKPSIEKEISHWMMLRQDLCSPHRFMRVRRYSF
jgi:hypothetical protein